MRNTLLDITPSLPDRLGRLTELASNLFFSWDRPTRALFEDLDPDLWMQARGNPRLFLRCIDQERLDRAADSPAFMARYAEILKTFDAYLAPTDSGEDAPATAYFCAEYGFHESIPIYSGGLGVLAADYCKTASDARLNFVGIGLLYGQGYFTQIIDNDGVQHASYAEQDPRDLPVELVTDETGQPLTVSVEIADRNVVAQIWKALVGRVTVYLLDTNCPQNSPADRGVTHRLYGGDQSTRIRQELILGVGGQRALRALGIEPAIWHLNEGHAAFLILELLRERVASGLEFSVALEAVASRCVFTTHTPVAAGHDAFEDGLLMQHIGHFANRLGLSAERLLELGRVPSAPGMFNMTRLALKGARRVNGVSRIHGLVSSQLCADHWPELKPEDNPVGFVTNGVHVPTFLHQCWAEFFDERLGTDWRGQLMNSAYWRRLEDVADAAYWKTAQSVKSRMLAGVRERLEREYLRMGLTPAQWRRLSRSVDPRDPNVLTIGFARRFATYKRAALLLKERERLERLVNKLGQPVVFLFAGKAHPADEPGKRVLREIVQLMLAPELLGSVIFIEDYDIQLARWLVSGVDVWLNNPIAPLEASGTSGIKAAINGRLNLSVLDGWWAEGWAVDNGWGITPVNVDDAERRDAIEAGLIFDTLEEEVAPLYYERNASGYSPEWVRRSKRAMATIIPQFSSRRTLHDYVDGLYRPAQRQYERLAHERFAGARALALWKQRVRAAWPAVALRLLADAPLRLPPRERLTIRVAVSLAGLAPSDVRIEFEARRRFPESSFEPVALSSYRGERLEGSWSATFAATGEYEPDGSAVFALDIEPPTSGPFVTQLRLYPYHELLAHPYELGLMKWL